MFRYGKYRRAIGINFYQLGHLLARENGLIEDCICYRHIFSEGLTTLARKADGGLDLNANRFGQRIDVLRIKQCVR